MLEKKCRRKDRGERGLNKWNQGIIIELFQNLSNVVLGTFSYNNQESLREVFPQNKKMTLPYN